MKTLQQIVDDRNAKLAAKNKPIVVRKAKVTRESIASRTYVPTTNVLCDASVRAAAIGRRT